MLYPFCLNKSDHFELKTSLNQILFVSLFHLYTPVTRKRRWRYILNEFAPVYELSISEFSGCFFDFLPLNLLLVRSHQADIIIVKRLIQGRNNVYDEVGVEPRSHDCDHTVAIKRRLILSITLPT